MPHAHNHNGHKYWQTVYKRNGVGDVCFDVSETGSENM
jgi:hypothetical protein